MAMFIRDIFCCKVVFFSIRHSCAGMDPVIRHSCAGRNPVVRHSCAGRNPVARHSCAGRNPVVRHSCAGRNPGKIMYREKQPYVYILASYRNGTLYTGVTSHLIQRIWQHKDSRVKGFTQKYNIYDLVYYEQHESMEFAILREKQIKKWKRAWKIRLIEGVNPDWEDLYDSIIG